MRAPESSRSLAGAVQALRIETEYLADGLLDIGQFDGAGTLANALGQGLFRQRKRDRLVLRLTGSLQRVQRAGKLAGMRRQMRGHIMLHLAGKRHLQFVRTVAARCPAGFRNRAAPKRHCIPPANRVSSSGPRSLQLRRSSIGRKHHLPSVAQQRIDRMQQLSHRGLLAAEELHVVDQQGIDAAVFAAEEGQALAVEGAQEI